MSRRQTREPATGKTAEKKSFESFKATASFKVLADFEYLYMEGGEACMVTGKAGEPFELPEGWSRDGVFFVLPDERRVRLPVE